MNKQILKHPCPLWVSYFYNITYHGCQAAHQDYYGAYHKKAQEGKISFYKLVEVYHCRKVWIWEQTWYAFVVFSLTVSETCLCYKFKQSPHTSSISLACFQNISIRYPPPSVCPWPRLNAIHIYNFHRRQPILAVTRAPQTSISGKQPEL